MRNDDHLIFEALKSKNPAPGIGIQHGLERIEDEIINIIKAVQNLDSVPRSDNTLSLLTDLQEALKYLEGELFDKMHKEENAETQHCKYL